jgi:hypothetical protein
VTSFRSADAVPVRNTVRVNALAYVRSAYDLGLPSSRLRYASFDSAAAAVDAAGMATHATLARRG